jgi:hypothetical protein
MPLAEVYVGSNATWGTEWSFASAGTSLNAVTSPGIYSVWLDCNAMTSGDNYIFRVYEKVRAGSTKRAVVEHVLNGVQTPANWLFPAMHLMNGFDFTLQRTVGTDRSIEYSVRRIT